MALPFDQLNTAATRDILPNIVDLNFRNDPFLAKLRASRVETFQGGIGWQDTFLFDAQPGGAYKKGAKLSTDQKQTISSIEFRPRYYDIPVSLLLEDIEVENAGPQVVIKLADLRLQEAALGMSARLAIDMHRHGQNLSGDDRSAKINGLAEAINDGTTTSWEGTAGFTTYGGTTRTDVNGALNADLTDPAANVNGPITYDILEFSYNNCVIGAEHPDIGVTSNRGMSLIKAAFQPQQRLEGTDPEIGFLSGLKFNQAVIFQSQYCPGTKGKNDATLGNYLASAGEVFWWLNSSYWKFVVVASKIFAFGFTGFVPAQDDSSLVGHYKFGGTLTCFGPRYNYLLFGIK